MYQGKILLSDLDGTLLNSNREISAKNVEAITYFTENGGRFGVATGRDIQNTLNIVAHLPINFFCIFSNGSVLYDPKEKEVMAEHVLNKEKILPFLERCMKERPDIGIQVHTDLGTVFCPDESKVDPSTVATHRPYICKTLEEVANCSLRKILFITKDGDFSWLVNESESLAKEIKRVQSSKVYYEFLPYGSSKGSMIEEVRPFISVNDTLYAVGDFYNDVEMMELSDVGILCKNAPEDIKKYADFICKDNNSDPIYDVVHNILKD